MPIRIAQVGLGGWGQNWAINVLPLVDDVTVAARVDPVAAGLEALAAAEKKLGHKPVPTFASLADALDAVDVDGVLITATLPAHAPLTRTALAAGKHVLVEKPFAATVEEAKSLVRQAEAVDRILMVSQNYRFYPAPQVVADLVQSGQLGSVQNIELDFRRYVVRPNKDHAHYRLRQPLLMDMAIHHFDLMRLVLDDEPAEIYCYTWNPPDSHFVDDPCGVAIVRFRGGAVVSYRGSWLSQGDATPWAGAWRMECERGAISWTSRGDQADRTSSERVCVRTGPQQVEDLALPSFPHYDRAGTITAFADAVRTGTSPRFASTGRDNLNSLALMEAAVASAQQGVPVSVPIV